MTILRLTKIEREVLKKKYVSNNLTWEEAQSNIEVITKHLENLVTTLKSKKKGIPEIESKFKEEFEKICQKAEAGLI